MEPRAVQIATILAEETEAQREIERAKFPPEDRSKLNSLAAHFLESYADRLHWELLLTFGDCATRSAKRAGMGVVEVVEFARSHCKPHEFWLLFWFASALSAYRHRGDAELNAQRAADELAKLQAKHQRIRTGARVGGQKSAQTRRQIQRTPTSEELLRERQKLIEGGMRARDVASFQSKQYNVSPAAIRAAYKRN